MSRIFNLTVFTFKEALRSVSKTKVSFFLALTAVILSIILVMVSLLINNYSSITAERLKENLFVTVFLDNISQTEINLILEKLRENPNISGIEYISGEQAKEKLKKEAGIEFEEFLGYNPLPNSIRIKLKDFNIEESAAGNIIDEIESIKGVVSAEYPLETVNKVTKLLNQVSLFSIILTIVLVIVALYVSTATFKLINMNRENETKAMLLVGAGRFLTKIPVLIGGLILGLSASFLTIAFTFFIIYYFKHILSSENFFSLKIVFFIFLTGPLIGLISSSISVLKNEKKNIDSNN